MIKKSSHGLLQKKYSVQEDKLLLSNQTNYFEDTTKKVGIGVYQVKNVGDFQEELSLLKNYEKALQTIGQTLGDKQLKYKARDERVYFKINDQVINHLHPLFKDVSRVINKIVLNEELAAVDALWIDPKKDKIQFTKSKKIISEKLDLSQCKKSKLGHVCTFKDYGIYFVN